MADTIAEKSMVSLEELFSSREIKESSTLAHRGKSKVWNYRPQGAASGAPSPGSEHTRSALDKEKCREKWGLLLKHCRQRRGSAAGAILGTPATSLRSAASAAVYPDGPAHLGPFYTHLVVGWLQDDEISLQGLYQYEGNDASFVSFCRQGPYPVGFLQPGYIRRPL